MSVSAYRAAVAILEKNKGVGPGRGEYESPVVTFNPYAKKIEVYPADDLIEQRTSHSPHSVFVVPLEDPVNQFASAFSVAGAILGPSAVAQMVFVMPKNWQDDAVTAQMYTLRQPPGVLGSRLHLVETKTSDVMGSTMVIARALSEVGYPNDPAIQVQRALAVHNKLG